MRRAKFAPRVPCALEPRAFGLFFDLPPPPAVEMRGDVALVTVRGPLMHHEDPCFDSYDAIKSRVVSCLTREDKPRAIVLVIDSPGGMVSGCFDTTDEIRARCADAGVPLYSYVDAQATSAAYALACAGSRIVVPPTGMVGSIGCIAELVDVSAMNAAMGISVALITSGKRKADGNPAVPLDDAATAAIQAQVMQLAALFFDHVALSRPMQVDEVRALEAGVVIGASAVPALADEVLGLDGMISAIAAGTFGQVAVPAGTEGGDMKTKIENAGVVQASKTEDDEAYEAAVATLRKAAASGNAKAKKMLQAEVADDEPTTEPKKEEPAAAAPPVAPAKEEPDGDEKSAHATARAALAEAKAARRETMLAARPDLSPELRASLEALEPDAIKSILAATPVKPTSKLGDAAATAALGATRGAGQTGAIAPSAQRAQINAAMGVGVELVQPELRADGRQTFPALTRREGARFLEARAAEEKANAAK